MSNTHKFISNLLRNSNFYSSDYASSPFQKEIYSIAMRHGIQLIPGSTAQNGDSIETFILIPRGTFKTLQEFFKNIESLNSELNKTFPGAGVRSSLIQKNVVSLCVLIPEKYYV